MNPMSHSLVHNPSDEEMRWLQLALEHSTDSVYWVASTGRIFDVNGKACQAHERERGELCSLHYTDLDKYCSEKGWDAVWDQLKTCGTVAFETEHRTKSGHPFAVIATAALIHFGGKERCVVFTRALIDQASRATAQEEQARFRAIFEGVETGIFVIDPETHRIADVNPLALQMIGASREKVVGAVCHKFVCPAQLGRCPVTDLGQIVDNSERVLLTTDGQQRSIIKTVRPVEMGGHAYLLESFLDITDRKRAEQALEERTAYLNTLIETNPLATVVLDRDERVQTSNSAFERLFLYLRDEMRGVSLDKLIIPEELASESRFFTQECLSGRSVRITTRRRRKDKTDVDVDIYAVPLVIADKPQGILALYQDVTERKQIEAEMAERHSLATLAAEVGVTLTGAASLPEGLQACAEIVVRNTGMCFARVWTVDTKEQVLELQASAGAYRALDPAEARVPIGTFRIGRIAASGEPYVTHTLLQDPVLGELEWTRKEGIVAFAGYPLKVGEQILGVCEVFAQQPLTDALLQAFDSVAHSIAQFTERKRAEESLRESEDRFRTAFEEAPYGMCMTGLDGRFLHANATLCSMLGYSQDELLAGAWQEITHPDDLPRSRELSRQFAEERANTLEIEKRYIRKQGETVWARVKISAVRNQFGQNTHFISQIEDITGRKQADQAQAFLASLVESSQDAIIGSNLQGIVVSWNHGAAELYGYGAEEMIGKSISLLIPDDSSEKLPQLLQRVLRGERISGQETVRMRKDGRRVDVSLAISPVFDATGTVTGAATIARDITSRKQAEQALQNSEEKFRQLAENVHEVFWMMPPAGDEILYVSPAYEQVWGMSCGSLYRDPISRVDAIHPDDVDQARLIFSRQLRGEVADSVYRIHTPEGREKWIRDRAFPIRDKNGQLTRIVGVAEDISESKLAEERLRASEERYRELFENASDLVYTFDLEMSITSLNRLAEETTGYLRDDAVQMNLRDLVDAKQWALTKSAIDRLVAGDPPTKIEVEIKAKHGRRVRLEMNPRLIYRDDKPVGIQAIARDITGRDVAEMELRQAQKLESVGRLASGIAHEINTPIQFVGDNARFLQESFEALHALIRNFHQLCDSPASVPPSELSAKLHEFEHDIDCAYLLEEIPKALSQSLEGVERVVTIVRAMKEFAHPDRKGMGPADINKALLSTLTVARNELKYVADVETHFGELPMVVCSVGDLNQVFLNLLVNASHAISDVVQNTGKKGKICVNTSVEGNHVLISISDTGSGIPAEIHDRIFDPFFTTKEVGRGTGQGLAIARSVVVDHHKGKLTFESRVGKGTTFFIRLPIEGSEGPI